MMRRALSLAASAPGRISPNPRVGAVIVRDGRIISEGIHLGPGKLHAEAAAIADAKKELESNDVDRMKAAMDKLTAVGAELYQEVQKTAQAAGPAEGEKPAGAKPEGGAKKTEKKADVVDADFEVVDDDKKK